MDGHLVTFTEESFLISLSGLVRLSIIPFETNPKSWYGRQVLVIYGSQAYVQAREVQKNFDLILEKVEKLKRLRERWAPSGTWRRKLLNRFVTGLWSRAEIGPNSERHVSVYEKIGA